MLCDCGKHPIHPGSDECRFCDGSYEYVSHWLLSNATKAVEVRVRIGRTIYYGALYTTYPHKIKALYLVGRVPASYRRSRMTEYRQGKEKKSIWYITRVHGSYHELYRPFGVAFQLTRSSFDPDRHYPIVGMSIDKLESL